LYCKFISYKSIFFKGVAILVAVEFDFSQNIDNMIVATATKVAAPEQLKLQLHNH